MKGTRNQGNREVRMEGERVRKEGRREGRKGERKEGSKQGRKGGREVKGKERRKVERKGGGEEGNYEKNAIYLIRKVFRMWRSEPDSKFWRNLQSLYLLSIFLQQNKYFDSESIITVPDLKC